MARAIRIVRVCAVALAIAGPVASNAALGSGRGVNVALALSAAQAVALGVLLWPALTGRVRLLAVLGPAALGAGVGLATAWSARVGLLAAAGLGHALLYGGLLAVFGESLMPGRVSVATRIARRINPHFHAGMVAYTRAVTAVWCAFFAAQLALSAGLLAFAPIGWWLLLVGSLHGPMAAGLALLEFGIRRRRWPGQHATLRMMASSWRT